MGEPIIYNGEEFKDRFVATTKYSPSLRMRLEFLFCHSTTVEYEIFTKEIMPRETTICHVHITSIFDRIRAWYWNKRGYGQMEAPQFEEPCNTK